MSAVTDPIEALEQSVADNLDSESTNETATTTLPSFRRRPVSLKVVQLPHFSHRLRTTLGSAQAGLRPCFAKDAGTGTVSHDSAERVPPRQETATTVLNKLTVQQESLPRTCLYRRSRSPASSNSNDAHAPDTLPGHPLPHRAYDQSPPAPSKKRHRHSLTAESTASHSSCDRTSNNRHRGPPRSPSSRSVPHRKKPMQKATERSVDPLTRMVLKNEAVLQQHSASFTELATRRLH